MQFIKIVLLCEISAIGYGIVHDQITAHLCVEYFTVAHPPLLATRSPFLLAIAWGIVATWWVALPLGIALAAVARAGKRNRLTVADVRPLVLRLLVVMALCASIAGATGALLVATGRISFFADWAQNIDASKRVAFEGVAWAHLTSYVTGVVGGTFIICNTVWLRLVRRGWTR